MEETKNCDMLDLMIQPGFCVRDGMIVKVNSAARALLLAPDMAVQPLLLCGGEEYAGFSGGCLYLQLDLGGISRGASVTRMGNTDLFLLDTDEEDGELRALALAARELRGPLADLIAITENLLPHSLPAEDPKASALLARMSRELYRMQRVLGNMADAGQMPALSCQVLQNLAQVFDDIFEKAGALLETAGVTILYKGLPRDVYGLADSWQIERAVLNILSNAAKFMPKGSNIQAALGQTGNILRLTITNSSGPEDENLGSLHSRYLRQPGLEDSRHGIGLGMVLIRSAAASHGGTVLVDHPKKGFTRITLTIKVRQCAEATVRSPFTELTGGRDQALIELSDILPPSVYQKNL